MLRSAAKNRPLGRAAAFASGCLALASCQRPTPPLAATEALPHNRYVIGTPAPWTPAALAPDELGTSVTARRAAGWSVVARAMQPVPILDPRSGRPLTDAASGEPLTLPTWQTWYELSEFRAIFQDYYWRKLSAAQRRDLVADPVLADQVLREFPRTPLEERWRTPAPGETLSPFERLLPQLASEPSLRSLNGVSGQGYTLFSPSLIRHYLLHYASVYRCHGSPAPGEVTGTSADFATCFGEAFPPDAVAIKATWARESDGVAEFDTSARGLAQLMTPHAQGGDEQSWTPLAGLRHPAADEAYTASTFLDDRRTATYRLTGLHIATKEIPDWLWVTLWWSPTPDTDFGEDRPSSLPPVGRTTRCASSRISTSVIRA